MKTLSCKNQEHLYLNCEKLLICLFELICIIINVFFVATIVKDFIYFWCNLKL
jgi:hypothetical protein